MALITATAIGVLAVAGLVTGLVVQSNPQAVTEPLQVLASKTVSASVGVIQPVTDLFSTVIDFLIYTIVPFIAVFFFFLLYLALNAVIIYAAVLVFTRAWEPIKKVILSVRDFEVRIFSFIFERRSNRR